MKELLITTDESGLNIVPDTGEERVLLLSDKQAQFERTWDPDEWLLYTRRNMKFSVKKDQTIQLRLDPNTMLRHYHFSAYIRPNGEELSHWTDQSISIDDARDIHANFTGKKAVDCFIDLKIKNQLLQFKYVGPNAKKDSEGIITKMHYFAYDLYLKVPTTDQELWIGPVIKNDGGIGGEP